MAAWRREHVCAEVPARSSAEAEPSADTEDTAAHMVVAAVVAMTKTAVMAAHMVVAAAQDLMDPTLASMVGAAEQPLADQAPARIRAVHRAGAAQAPWAVASMAWRRVRAAQASAETRRATPVAVAEAATAEMAEMMAEVAVAMARRAEMAEHSLKSKIRVINPRKAAAGAGAMACQVAEEQAAEVAVVTAPEETGTEMGCTEAVAAALVFHGLGIRWRLVGPAAPASR